MKTKTNTNKTKQSKTTPSRNRQRKDAFEQSTRQIRWLCIFLTATAFPWVFPQIWYVFILVALAMAYNLLRYSQTMLSMKWFTSPLFILTVDSIFVAGLISVIGNISTPFSAFIVFLVVTAAYQYRLIGAVVIVATQSLWLIATLYTHWFPSLELSPLRSAFITIVFLVALGVQIEQLTRIEHRERDRLRRLSRKSESERSHLLTLINSLTTAVFVVGDDGRISLYNEAARQLAGRQDDLRGQSFSSVMPLHVRTDVKAKAVQLFNDQTSVQRRRDLCLTTEEGATIDLDVTVQPAHLESDADENFIVVCEDITRERSLDEQRTEFISVASHELRTPIAIMEASLSIAAQSKEPIPEQIRSLVTQAHDSALYLGSIVKDLSLIAEASNDNLPIQLTQVEGQKVARVLAEGFETQAKQKGLQIILDIDPATPKVLSTERHIREILQNYMTNAIKYTLEGTVTMRVQPAKNGGALFSVADTGIGITPADQKHLFTKFFRVEDYRTRTTGGTGLGLYLCQELANRIGARVWCKSSLHNGSVFFLEIPPISSLSRDQGEVVKAQVANLVDSI